MTAVAALILLVVAALPASVLAAFTEEQKKEILTAHNDFRQNASPAAAAMNFVTWSKKLEDLAVAAAKRCLFEHTTGDPIYRGLGENIFASTGMKVSPKNVVKSWFDEKKDYDHTNRRCLDKKVCGHYTQVMRDEVTELGCGHAKCDGAEYEDFVFCNYNVPNGFYKYGAACSQCPKSRPACRNNLCVTKEVATDPSANAKNSTPNNNNNSISNSNSTHAPAARPNNSSPKRGSINTVLIWMLSTAVVMRLST